jgi:hypothetical protein
MGLIPLLPALRRVRSQANCVAWQVRKVDESPINPIDPIPESCGKTVT